MKALVILPLLQGATEEGLTVGEFLSNIPHDAAAIVVYVLVAFSVGLVVWAGRRGSNAPKADA